MAHFLGGFVFWAGTAVGVLNIVDWILLDGQKKWLNDQAAYAWLWLDEQRLGKFIYFFKSYKAQVLLSVLVYLLINLIPKPAVGLLNALSGMINAFSLRWMIDYTLEELARNNQSYLLNYPFRICLFISAAFVLAKLHPKFVREITAKAKHSVSEYFFQLTVEYFCLFYLTITLGYFFGFFSLLAFYIDGAPSTFTVASVLFMFLILIFASPILIEGGMLFSMFGLSVVWLISILLLMMIFRLVQFLLIRIVDKPKGPVLGLSLLLVLMGAFVKMFI